ncbi:MAG: bifunctional UDP-sugar hydrolase/5'-nucleotidase [Elusimicrobiota bacterium]
MKRLVLLIFSVFLSAQLIFAKNPAKVTILSMNDFHAEFNKAAIISSYINYYRKNQNNVVWVMSGDYFKGSALDSISKGKASIEILNKFAPDALSLGNHEFDWGADILEKRMKEAKFPFVCSNIVYESNPEKYFAQPYLIKEINGVKILFIGIIMENLDSLIGKDRALGLKVLPIKDTIEKICKKYGKDANLTVVLSHQGLREDELLAKELAPDAGVDIIAGGHSHALTENPEKINDIIITQDGAKGKTLGKLDVTVDLESRSVKDYDWKLIPMVETNEIKPDKTVTELLEKEEKVFAPGINEVIGRLTAPCDFHNFSCDAILEQLVVDSCFTNSGGIRKGLAGPEIKIRDIWEIFPFDDYWIKFKITPRQLWQLIESNIKFESERVIFSKSVKYTYDSSLEKGRRLIEVKINNKKIDRNDDKKLYSCATTDYLWNKIKGTEDFKKNGGYQELKDNDYKDLYIDYIRKHKVIESKLDDRAKDISQWR